MGLRRRTQAHSPLTKPQLSPQQMDGEPPSVYDQLVCEICELGNSASKMLLCDNCDKGFHLFCLRPILVSVPKGSWFCHACSKFEEPESFPLLQTKISDFFRIEKSSEAAAAAAQEKEKRRKRGRRLFAAKKKRKMLPYKPTEDLNRRLKQMQSLATALKAAKAVYSNELTYMPGMASRSCNDATLEKGGTQVLSKEDTKTLNLCKTMMSKGECPPLMVVHDKVEGFTVQADGLIKDMTIITEYCGDVDFMDNREDDDGDSIMALLFADDPSKNLVICPDSRSNIARFINGINNHTPDGRRKQNLKCVRFAVDGESRVLLVANRDIQKGERLYYDYNGYKHEYPTEHFV